MSTRHMVPGLRHDWAWSADESKFFQHIDAMGGWPVGYTFVGFYHTDDRAAGFTNSSRNDSWWTVVASADDYYLWKLSPAALQRVVDAAVQAIRLPTPRADSLRIKNSLGSRAAIAKSQENHGDQSCA